MVDDVRAKWLPGPYYFETRLQGVATIKRSYRQYCREDGFDLLESDVRDLFDTMVPEVLSLNGI